VIVLVPKSQAALIREVLPKVTNKQIEQIDEIMRFDIFHSTLDWQTKEQIQDAAKVAFQVMQEQGFA